MNPRHLCPWRVLVLSHLLLSPLEIQSLSPLGPVVTCHLVHIPMEVGTHKREPPSPPKGSEVRPKKVDHSNLHPGSAPHSNRPSAGTQVPAPAPKEDTLDHLGSTIHEQAPGNVYYMVALHPLVGWKLSQGCPGTVALGPQGGISHNIKRNPQVAITMVTHLQRGNNPLTGTSPSSIVLCYTVGYGQFSPYNSNYGEGHYVTEVGSFTITPSPW